MKEKINSEPKEKLDWHQWIWFIAHQEPQHHWEKMWSKGWLRWILRTMEVKLHKREREFLPTTMHDILILELETTANVVTSIIGQDGLTARLCFVSHQAQWRYVNRTAFIISAILVNWQVRLLRNYQIRGQFYSWGLDPTTWGKSNSFQILILVVTGEWERGRKMRDGERPRFINLSEINHESLRTSLGCVNLLDIWSLVSDTTFYCIKP